jgi:tetratricopeptide (TPR) repeat protein
MFQLGTSRLDVFEIVLEAIQIVNKYKLAPDETELAQAFDELRRASQIDPEYLLAPYYMAVIDDLLGRHSEAALRLADLLRQMQRTQKAQELGGQTRQDITLIILELRLNFATARYHLLRDQKFELLTIELDRLLDDLTSYRGQRYRTIRHRARVLQAQLLATRMIPSDPDGLQQRERLQISYYHKQCQALVCYLAFARRRFPYCMLRGRTLSSAPVAAIARNALARSEMYFTDYFCDPADKVERLRWALDLLTNDFDRFPGDPDNNYDRASCHMRLGYWEGSTAEYDKAIAVLAATMREPGPGYGFAAFTVGRIFRLKGEQASAIEHLTQAREIPAERRGVSDERVDRELRLAQADDHTYP